MGDKLGVAFYRYAENSKRVARMLAKKPFSSKEKLLKYVDFAAEFGQLCFTSVTN